MAQPLRLDHAGAVWHVTLKLSEFAPALGVQDWAASHLATSAERMPRSSRRFQRSLRRIQKALADSHIHRPDPDLTPSPAAAFCVPGEAGCDSYDAAAWAGTSPIQIKSVTFGDGSAAEEFAAVSDFGGKAEVNQHCSAYGGSFCIYPWFTLGSSGFHYGVDFPDTLNDFGQADQFAQTTQCGGPFGPNSTYCVTILQ